MREGGRSGACHSNVLDCERCNEINRKSFKTILTCPVLAGNYEDFMGKLYLTRDFTDVVSVC